jgi:UDP-galactopyranose mutase
MSQSKFRAETLNDIDVLVVGAGFFGATIAERISNVLNKKVVVIDGRSHIGGNSYSEIEPETKIEYHKYGSHLFHTSSEKIWNYVSRFTKFNDYKHHVYAKHNDNIFSLPINLLTICQFFNKPFSPRQAQDHVKGLIEKYYVGRLPSSEYSLKDKAISTIGPELYSAFIENYTKKQWQTDPEELPASIINRLPVRYNFDTKYFSDKYEGVPLEGYTNIFNNMLNSKNIEYFLDLNYFDIKNMVPNNCLTIYTGPIDRYYEYRFGELNWRTLDFQLEILDVEDFQGTSVINYVDNDVNFTRIHEFKHLHPERNYDTSKTLIMKEYSRFATKKDEPYYPVNSNQDRAKLQKYRVLASKEKKVIFGGRLGTYQYLDMHMAIGSALSLFENDIQKWFSGKTNY